jgi:hypothetical protein
MVRRGKLRLAVTVRDARDGVEFGVADAWDGAVTYRELGVLARLA